MNDFNQNGYQAPDNSESTQLQYGGEQQNNAASPDPDTAGQIGFYENSGYVSPVYVTKKRGVNPLAIILPAAALIIAGVVVFLMLMLNKPASYREAEKNFFGSVFDAAEEADAGISESFGSERVTVNFSTPLEDYIEVDLSELSLTVDAAEGENASYGLITAMLENGSFTAELWQDRADGKNYMFLPDISDIYIIQDYSQSTFDAERYREYAEGLREAVEKTAEVYFETVGEPAVERNQEFVVNGASYKADMASVHLDISQMAVICKTFCDYLAEDERTAEMIRQIGEYETVEDMREAYRSFSENMQDSIDGTGYADGAFDMKVYMKNNTVVGREIVISDFNWDKTISIDLYRISGEKGENGYLRFKYDDSEDVWQEFALEYKDEADGELHSGSVKLDIRTADLSGIDTAGISAEYSGLVLTDDKFGGDIDITLSASDFMDSVNMNAPTEYSANISLEKDGDRKTVYITVPNIFSISIASEPSDLEFKEVPSPAPDKSAVMVNGDFEDSEAYEKFSEDLLKYMVPGYGESASGADDYPYFPEVTEEETERNFDVIDMSVLEGEWVPYKMQAMGEVIDLRSAEYSGLIMPNYYFSDDGLITVSYGGETEPEIFVCYPDKHDDTRILIEDDIFCYICYDKSDDILVISSEEGEITAKLWLERK